METSSTSTYFFGTITFQKITNIISINLLPSGKMEIIKRNSYYNVWDSTSITNNIYYPDEYYKEIYGVDKDGKIVMEDSVQIPFPFTTSQPQRIVVTEDNIERIKGMAGRVFNVGTIIYFNSNNKFHNLNGPSIEWNDDYKEWWIEGRCVGDSVHGFTQERFEEWKNQNNIK
jgi:hypothetical protein